MIISLLVAAALVRLDPHGGKELKFTNACTTCHTKKAEKILTDKNAAETCVGCHNKAPHSGAPDHLGKIYNGHAITCMSCHNPHRKDGLMRKTCTECHKW